LIFFHKQESRGGGGGKSNADKVAVDLYRLKRARNRDAIERITKLSEAATRGANTEEPSESQGWLHTGGPQETKGLYRKGKERTRIKGRSYATPDLGKVCRGPLSQGELRADITGRESTNGG